MAKKTVFITLHNYPSIMCELLKERFEVICWDGTETLTKNELIENIKGKFGILCHSPNIIDKEVIEAAGDELKVVSTYSVGFNHLDLKELKSRGIRIGYTPDVLTEAVAEHAVTLLLATGRRILEAQQTIMKGEWTTEVWQPLWLCGQGLNRSTVGLVGCGRIGLSILKKLKSFNPSRILYYNRSEKLEANELNSEFKPLDVVMKESDFIVVALPQTPETKGIISKEAINSMKSNAILVNIGRGGLVDEEALIEALQNRKIGGAGLDVFVKEPLPLDSPLLKLDNVVITPHIASATYETRFAMAELAAKNILAVLDNEKMPYEL